MDVGPDASPAPDASSGHASYWAWVRVLFRWRWLIAGAILLACAAVIARGLLRPPTYVARTAFSVRNTNQGSTRDALASLVANTGIQLPQLMGGSQFYFAALVKSDDLLRQVASAEFEMSDGRSGNLVEIMNITGETHEERMDRAVGSLRRAVTTRTTARPNMVSFTVETRWPDLSLSLAERLLDKVSTFNVELMQSRGREERMFLEERITGTERAVREWEDSLQAFLAGNRQFGDYSQQRFEHDRLQAELERRRAIYSDLTRSREQALLTELRDGSTIIVLRSPRLPLRSRPRVRLSWVLVAGIMGAAAGIVFAVAVEMLSRSDVQAISRVQRLLPPSSVSARLLARAVRARAPHGTSSVTYRYDP